MTLLRRPRTAIKLGVVQVIYASADLTGIDSHAPYNGGMGRGQRVASSRRLGLYDVGRDDECNSQDHKTSNAREHQPAQQAELVLLDVPFIYFHGASGKDVRVGAGILAPGAFL